jgi:hypothetical protein
MILILPPVQFPSNGLHTNATQKRALTKSNIFKALDCLQSILEPTIV